MRGSRADTWVERDICDHEPWPFSDDQFDFAICSHVLEDVRDPVWVCHELNRVAKAGYIEVPSRLEEHSVWVNGNWAGWSHHHWLIDMGEESIDFVFKPHSINGWPPYHLPAPFGTLLTEAERVQSLWWEGGFTYRERIFFDLLEFDAYMAGFVSEARARLEPRLPAALECGSGSGASAAPAPATLIVREAAHMLGPSGPSCQWQEPWAARCGAACRRSRSGSGLRASTSSCAARGAASCWRLRRRRTSTVSRRSRPSGRAPAPER